eukprot:gene21158-37598_t
MGRGRERRGPGKVSRRQAPVRDLRPLVKKEQQGWLAVWMKRCPRQEEEERLRQEDEDRLSKAD